MAAENIKDDGSMGRPRGLSSGAIYRQSQPGRVRWPSRVAGPSPPNLQAGDYAGNLALPVGQRQTHLGDRHWNIVAAGRIEFGAAP